MLLPYNHETCLLFWLRNSADASYYAPMIQKKMCVLLCLPSEFAEVRCILGVTRAGVSGFV